MPTRLQPLRLPLESCARPRPMAPFSGSSCRDRTADFLATVERLRSSQVPCSVSTALQACCVNESLRPL